MRGLKLGGISFGFCAWGIIATCLASGCDVFDESLITPDAAPDGGVVKPALRTDEDISCDVPTNLSFNDYHEKIDIAGGQPDRGRLPSCLGGEEAPGQDVFFGVAMKAGEKWHFHAEAGEGYDPAVYVMDTCNNTDTCAGRFSGINSCPLGQGEHFSFLAPRTDRFVVGVDSLTMGTGGMRVLAVFADCGNGIIEHSEYCDTAIAVGETGYKADCKACRKWIPDGGDDAGSFNDGPLDAAILQLPDPLVEGRDFKFTGKIDKICDYDFFKFTLEEATSVRVTLAPTDGTGCEGWDVRLDDTDNPFEVEGGSDCPDIALDLDDGDHEIRVAGNADIQAALANYEITMTFGDDTSDGQAGADGE